MSELPSVTLNDQTYALAELSEAARNQVANIRVVDAEIARLQQQLAIAQTARNAYVAALASAVTPAPAPAKTGAASAKAPVKARSKKV